VVQGGNVRLSIPKRIGPDCNPVAQSGLVFYSRKVNLNV